MTTVAVMANPPTEGAVLDQLVDAEIVSPSEAVELYSAMVCDVTDAVLASGGELLLNYRPADQLPDDVSDSEATLRKTLEAEFQGVDDARFEVQVGSTYSARVGNTITHLLDREGINTAAFVRPEAALLGRRHIDGAAMKLRQNQVVLGASENGGVYYGAFSEPVDFTDAFEKTPLETLVERATDAECSVEFLQTLPTFGSTEGFSSALPIVRARAGAGREIPPRTYDVLLNLDIADAVAPSATA